MSVQTVETRLSKIQIEAELVPQKVAIATLTPDMLKKLAFISTYETKDPQSSSPRQHGYQREPMDARFAGIGKYYAKDLNRYLIPPIIASARVYTPEDQERFNELFNAGDIATIHAEFEKSAFSIVDGQHRMGGLYWAWQNIDGFTADVPVMIFYGLRYDAEAHLFDDINTNQRKLPKALIEATKVHMEAGEKKSHAQQIREISFALAQDGDSVWKDLVNMTGARDPNRSVTYEGLRRATSQMFPEKLLGRLSARGFTPEPIAKKFWELVSKACPAAWNDHPRLVMHDGKPVEEKVQYRLKDLVGVASLSRLAEDLITTSLDKTHNDNDGFWTSMTDLISRLGVVDWEKRPNNPWMAPQAGFAGQKELYEMLYNLVYLDVSPGEAVHPE